MTLLLYAITDGPPLGELPPGVEGAPVWAISDAGLSAVVSRHDAAPTLDERAAWAYEQVIEAVMSDAAVLPMRFGSYVSDRAAAQEILRDRAPELTPSLERIRGRVEVSVRAVWPQEDVVAPEAGDGRAYMEARLGPERRARALRDRIHETLDPLADASRYRLLVRPTAPVTAAFLVKRDRTEEFVRHAAALDARLAEADLTCTGPWPAYSFVGGDEA